MTDAQAAAAIQAARQADPSVGVKALVQQLRPDYPLIDARFVRDALSGREAQMPLPPQDQESTGQDEQAAGSVEVPAEAATAEMEEAAGSEEDEAAEEEEAAGSLGDAQAAPASDAARKKKKLKKKKVVVADLLVSGCGSRDVNGTYRADGERDGVPCYRRVGGDGGRNFTIERDTDTSDEDPVSEWCICVDYGFDTYCFIKADTDLPPGTGWSTTPLCVDPAPVLHGGIQPKTGGQRREKTKPHAIKPGSQSARRRHAMADAHKKYGIKKKRKVKMF